MSSSSAPLVSVLIPAYNAERTIGAAISGALAQTYENLEVVVVDDGSTDATRAICESFGDLITFASIENSGTAGARNAAIERARGDFLALCDADDVLLPPHVEAAMAAWEAAGGGRRFVHGDAYLLTAGGIAHGRTVFPVPTPPAQQQRLRILEANYVSIFAVMPAQMARELGGFTPGVYLEDWDLWMRAVFAGWEVVAQPTPHALYRTGGESKSADRESVRASETQMLRRIADDPGVSLSAAERDYLALRLAGDSPRDLIAEAETALRDGDPGRARELFERASRLWPSNRNLRIKTASMAVPGVPALWRRRLRGIDAGLGREVG